jgi:Tol biopolymer transport system component
MAAIRPLGFSNTGSFLYVQQLGNQNVFAQQLDRLSGKAVGEPQKLVDTYVGANTTPSWSPDGKSIAYFSRRVEPTDQNSPATLVIRSVESGQETTIPTTFTYPGQPRWFPDGQSILQVARNNQNTTCFYKVDVRTGSVRELVNTGSGLPPGSALSPDGSTVYVRHAQKFDTIAAYDLATGRQTDIHGPSLEGPFLAIAPSPDGRRLAYPARSSSGSLRLYVTNSDGSDARDLLVAHPQTGYITGLTWTADSKWIYFVLSDSAVVLGHNSQLWRVAADGAAPEYTGLAASTMRALSLHPDGTRLIFAGGELLRSEYWALDNLNLAWSTSPQKSPAGR